VTRDASDRSYLSGYGVALDLKKMEYLAVDDRQGSSATVSESRVREEEQLVSDPIVELLNQYPINEAFNASIPLTEEEISCAQYSTAQSIYTHDTVQISAYRQRSSLPPPPTLWLR
jgi:UDP-glucose:glycoprotein glucosyltransferase